MGYPPGGGYPPVVHGHHGGMNYKTTLNSVERDSNLSVAYPPGAMYGHKGYKHKGYKHKGYKGHKHKGFKGFKKMGKFKKFK